MLHVLYVCGRARKDILELSPPRLTHRAVHGQHVAAHIGVRGSETGQHGDQSVQLHHLRHYAPVQIRN